jgi:hypothetical protein
MISTPSPQAWVQTNRSVRLRRRRRPRHLVLQARHAPRCQPTKPFSRLRLRPRLPPPRLVVDHSSTLRRGAMARNHLRFGVKSVIDRQLFAGHYLSPAEKKHVVAKPSGRKIRVTGMINQFRSIATDRSVENPAAVEAQQISRFVRPVTRVFFVVLQNLLVQNTFAPIFNHPSVRRNRFPSEETQTMDVGPADSQMKRRGCWVNLRPPPRRGFSGL